MSITPSQCVRLYGSHYFMYSHSVPVMLSVEAAPKPPTETVEYKRPAHWRVSYCVNCGQDSHEAVGFTPPPGSEDVQQETK